MSDWKNKTCQDCDFQVDGLCRIRTNANGYYNDMRIQIEARTGYFPSGDYHPACSEFKERNQ